MVHGGTGARSRRRRDPIAGVRTEPLDEHLDPALRRDLEERFWRPIEQLSTLEALRTDPAFLTDPTGHPALYGDHAVVHVRDIGTGLIELAGVADGSILPSRPPDRQRFLVAYGLLATYLHDIGMFDQTPVGRRVHAVYAAHVAFSDEVDDIVARVLAGGAVAARLIAVDRVAPFHQPLSLVLRELLSLTMAHSKSTVPIAVLDDPGALRRMLQQAVFTDLAVHRGTGAPWLEDGRLDVAGANAARYRDPVSSFGWLDSPEPAHVELAQDAVDAIRLLRAADALRQRGTALRTSGGFEICIDALTGSAVYTLRSADGAEAYLLRCDDPVAAGEANLRIATISPAGQLRIAFHRGSFHTAAAEQAAVRSCASVVVDIADDVLPVVDRPWRPAMRVEVERPGDRPSFTDEVVRLVLADRPGLAGRLAAVADVEGADPLERDRYHSATVVEPAGREAEELLTRMAEHGARTDGIDVAAAFAEARAVTIRAGEVLVALGSPPSFVYVATGPGLRVFPGGGYESRPLQPWVPVGTTGAVRRAERNSEIVAEEEVEVVMVPADAYAVHWFRPYLAAELADVLGSGAARR